MQKNLEIKTFIISDTTVYKVISFLFMTEYPNLWAGFEVGTGAQHFAF